MATLKEIPRLLCFCIVVLASCVSCDSPTGVRIEQPEWHRSGEFLVFDHHTHTRFSDGALELSEVVRLAKENGCDAVAISDHSDVAASYSRRYFDALDSARTEFQNILVFGGMELNAPSYGGREHLGIVVNPFIERRLLADIGSKGKRLGARPGLEDDRVVLKPLAESVATAEAVVIYNHPSRKAQTLEESLRDHNRWSSILGENLILAGAPGHQKALDIGSYQYLFATVNRWDPVVTTPGRGWDTLLIDGMKVWAAVAGSDFHNSKLDYAPCEFSRTHVQVGGRSYADLLKGLKAGTFWAGHGRVLKQLALSIDIGATETAKPGATVFLDSANATGIAHFEIERDKGDPDSQLTAYLITNCMDGAVSVVEIEIGRGSNEASSAIFFAFDDPSASCFARGVVAADSSGLFAYTNPIFFRSI